MTKNANFGPKFVVLWQKIQNWLRAEVACWWQQNAESGFCQCSATVADEGVPPAASSAPLQPPPPQTPPTNGAEFKSPVGVTEVRAKLYYTSFWDKFGINVNYFGMHPKT